MQGRTLARRLAKKALKPLLSDSLYSAVQSVAMAWDIKRGTLGESEIALLPSLVGRGDTVLDIGANYGMYSYHLSRLVGTAGRVYAFEPVPFTARTLRRILRLLDLSNVTLIEKGASDRAGEVSFTLPLQDSGAPAAGQAHLGGRDDERPGRDIHHKYSATRPVVCEVVRIDDELSGVPAVSFIKADIEGAELLAFRGAQKIIERDRPSVLCEINPWFLQGFGIPLRELLDFFAKKGYGLYSWEESSGRLRHTDPACIVEDNYLFLHPDRSERWGPLVS